MKSVPRPQKLQKEWEEEYAAGLLDMRYLWDRGFRPKSNKYRLAEKKWKYYKKHYTVTLELSSEDYQELKDMPYEIEREEREKEELYEYMHWNYLNEKYGE